MNLRAHSSSLVLRSLAAGAAFLLLAQSVGINLLCFCGSCELSQSIGVGNAAPEHPCCREARARERLEASKHTTVSGPHRCCADDHALTRVDANVRDRDANAAPDSAPVFVALHHAFAAALPQARTVAASLRSRAPPNRSASALYLQHACLLI